MGRLRPRRSPETAPGSEAAAGPGRRSARRWARPPRSGAEAPGPEPEAPCRGSGAAGADAPAGGRGARADWGPRGTVPGAGLRAATGGRAGAGAGAPAEAARRACPCR